MSTSPLRLDHLRRASSKRAMALATAFMIVASAELATPAAAQTALLGFDAAGTAAQRELEKRFDAQLDAEELRGWLKQLSSAPNQVGSAHNKENAEFVQRQFAAWGFDARIETYRVLYPILKSHAVELLAPKYFKASLREPAIKGDATSSRHDGVPPYHAYGGDGDVTGLLVYVNYGMPDDYKDLARRGIDVTGKIVIARYGAGWRGLKPKLAQEHGALGCIIYSDPRDDGYFEGDVYPQGGWRPSGSVQRGSVLDMPVYPGDPLTPGVAATADAKRLSRDQATTILRIPVLPMSYADAQPLLAALSGPVAPQNWRGALPLTYHMGPGPAKVRLQVQSNWDLKTIYNVIATVRGSQYPDEWVIRGNHRDAWVFGASDPLSGTVAMLAEAKSIGALLKQGWRPSRTLVYASWDAEEPGLIGSTEWVEAHADELINKTVLYLNSDSNQRGFLGAGGSHALQHFVNEVAQDVTDPQTKVSVGERLRARILVRANEKGATEAQRMAAKKVEGGDLPIAALGSGSDFSPFLQYLGVNTLQVAYGGEDEEDGVYHSNYDSFDHYSRFGDPTFAYGVAEAQTAGRMVLRMADAQILPLEFHSAAATFGDYVQELHKLADDQRKAAETVNKLIAAHSYEIATDPTRPIAAPEAAPPVPFIELALLDNAAARLSASAQAYDNALAQHGTLTPNALAELNALLRGIERTLTDDRGLPGRPWYRHLVYAPGLLTGYGVKTLPGVREAIEANQWGVANEYAQYTAAALNRYAEQLEKATAILQR